MSYQNKKGLHFALLCNRWFYVWLISYFGERGWIVIEMFKLGLLNSIYKCIPIYPEYDSTTE